MITQEELTRMLTELEEDRIEKTILKLDSDKFGEGFVLLVMICLEIYYPVIY